MFKTLAPHASSISPPDIPSAIRYAQLGGFKGLEFSAHGIADLIEQQGLDAVRKMFLDAHIIPAGWGLPVDWRTTEQNFQRDLERLPHAAQAAEALGAHRCFTWVMPCSNERAFDENYAFHVHRFKPIAQILARHNQSLGLEFIGPRTLRESQKFPFIHTMSEMLRLGRDIGPNVGLLLDCWHWYTSRGTIEQLRDLRPEQVVYVHVNDAPAGVDIDEQIDNVRRLPGQTSVIDIVGFLQALEHIGYDGPVTPEPFLQELKDLPSDEARVKVVGEAMDNIFRQAGIS